ncbi:MAG: AraC family transcriptional regulator N-terminal domain-containing protein [Pseudomonadota bacterium]
MSTTLERAAKALLDHYGDRNPGGFSDTDLPRVRYFFTDAYAPRTPLHYPPGLAIILSGKKIGYLDGRRFEYGAGSYLAVGLPLVFECETHASPDVPMFGLFLELCPTMLSELGAVLPMQEGKHKHHATHQGVEPLIVKPPMAEAVGRLVDQLCQPPQAKALGSGTLREILFHALSDDHGRVLLALTQLGQPEARIANLLRWAETQGNAPLDTETLAGQAGMSPATLHRYFRSVTGYPPLQYFKRQRLLRAREFLTAHQMTVAQAAHSIGYGDPTNFSRDYRKLFGYPPSHERQVAAKLLSNTQSRL